MQNSIHKKNKVFKKHFRCNSEDNKNVLMMNIKVYRNNLSTLMKQSKKRYYSIYFKPNISNIKNT